MKIQGTDLIVSIDPLSYACGVEVLSGTLRQSYDKSDKAYSPSRIAIPLVLLPWIGAYGDDHDSAENTGHLKLQNVTYILKRIVNKTWTETNLNTTPVSGYKVALPTTSGATEVELSIGVGSSASVQKFPAYSLVVEEDVPATETREIEMRINCVDPQTGVTVERVVSEILSTNSTESASFKLRAANYTPENSIINPLRRAKDINGKRTDTLSVQLYRDNEEVPDANAIYWWYFWENGVPKLITEDNQIFLTEGLTNGVFSKSITINTDYFNKIVLMCRAAYWDGTGSRPTAPSDEDANLKVIFNRSRRYSRKITGSVVGTKGVKITPQSEFERNLQMSDRYGELSEEEITEHFDVSWNKRLSTGVVSFIGVGTKVSGVAKDFGVTEKVSVGLIPNVTERGHFMPIKMDTALLRDTDGKILVIQ